MFSQKNNDRICSWSNTQRKPATEEDIINTFKWLLPHMKATIERNKMWVLKAENDIKKYEEKRSLKNNT